MGKACGPGLHELAVCTDVITGRGHPQVPGRRRETLERILGMPGLARQVDYAAQARVAPASILLPSILRSASRRLGASPLAGSNPSYEKRRHDISARAPLDELIHAEDTRRPKSAKGSVRQADIPKGGHE